MIRKIVCFTCAAMTLLLFAFVEAASASKTEYGQVMAQNVNMRAEASSEAEQIQKLPIGVEVQIITEKNGWYYVSYNGKAGYIRNDLVFVSSMEKRIAYALEDDVNLRGGPGIGSYIVKKVIAGKSMQIRSVVGEWYFVKYEGVTGFVHKDLVSVSKQSGTGNAMLLRSGMQGLEVKRLQQELANRNFLDKKYITGSYGTLTRQAVKDFQKAANVKILDGIAGTETINLIYDKTNKTRKAPKIPTSKQDFYGLVKLIDWWKGGNKVLKRPGGVATIYDVRTGKTYRIRRTGGTNHNDIAPLTAKDTAVLKATYGGKWSWSRRSILVIVNGKAYAASINGMPHGRDPQKNDGVSGMFCIHFTNSRTHGGNRVDGDHQSMIKYAYNQFKKK